MNRKIRYDSEVVISHTHTHNTMYLCMSIRVYHVHMTDAVWISRLGKRHTKHTHRKRCLISKFLNSSRKTPHSTVLCVHRVWARESEVFSHPPCDFLIALSLALSTLCFSICFLTLHGLYVRTKKRRLYSGEFGQRISSVNDWREPAFSFSLALLIFFLIFPAEFLTSPLGKC